MRQAPRGKASVLACEDTTNAQTDVLIHPSYWVLVLLPLPLQFSTIFLMVFGGEVLADWIKHGFIIKFNQLTPSIYDEYSTILARCDGFDSSS